MSAHILIENTLVQHKLAKNLCMVYVLSESSLKALADVMGFIVVPVSLAIASLL